MLSPQSPLCCFTPVCYTPKLTSKLLTWLVGFPLLRS